MLEFTSDATERLAALVRCMLESPESKREYPIPIRVNGAETVAERVCEDWERMGAMEVPAQVAATATQHLACSSESGC
jgi:hypothetical protein